MLIEINNTHQSSGLHKVCDFHIETNGIMVKALTSRLYSNPISSIVRELASNALDACPTRPMEIRIPTSLAPSFSIRDHGPGLSPQQMSEVFTRFGASTKRNDNNQIGGFGLGAKSPFAIVNSYTITSYHQGIATTYMASITSNGMPALHQVSSQPTNETGLHIEVPAPTTASLEWRKALSQLDYFQPQPIIRGIQYDFPTPFHDTPDYLIVKSDDIGVLVGPVFYPVDPAKLGLSYWEIPRGMVVKCPIGTIEVTASREEVVYSPATISTLKGRFAHGRQHYREITRDLISKCRTAPEVWRVLASAIFDTIHDFTTPTGTTFKISGSALHFGDDPTYGGNVGIAELDSRRRRRKRWILDWRQPDRIGVDDHCYFLDDTRRWQERVQNHFIKATHGSQQRVGDILLFQDPTILDDAGIPYTKVSSIPTDKPLRNPSQRKAPRTLGQRNKLIRMDTAPTHFISVDVDGNVATTSVKLTYDILRRMEKRISQHTSQPTNICVITPTCKTDISNLPAAFPEWRTIAHQFIKGNPLQVTRRWDHHGYYTNFHQALVDLGKMPAFHRNSMPEHYHLDIVSLAADALPPKPDYEGKFKALCAQHPWLLPLECQFNHADIIVVTRVLTTLFNHY